MKWFVTFFAVGTIKKAPGTMGTLAAAPLVYLVAQLGPFLYMGFTLALTLAAILIIDQYEKQSGTHDKQEIVIDEVIGFLITMTWLPQTWQAYVLGFLLFRALDIWKPLVIGMIDKRLKGGLGVVADDVAAGLVANLILQILYNHTVILGQRL